jgi:hypothetical protein
MTTDPNMYHHNGALLMLGHLAPAHALAALTVVAVMTASGVAVQRLRRAFHHT